MHFNIIVSIILLFLFYQDRGLSRLINIGSEPSIRLLPHHFTTRTFIRF